MKVSIFYFSGTGNTLYAAEKLAHYLEQNFETKLFSIEDEIDRSEFFTANILVFAYPIYLSDMPINMKNFISDLPKQNKSVCTICTQALFSGDGGYVAHDVLEEKGYAHTWSVQLKAFTNIGLMGLKPSSDYEGNKEVLLKMDEDLMKLADDIRDCNTSLSDSGFFSYLLGMTQRPFYKMAIKSYSRKLHVNVTLCNQCETCVKGCPESIIVNNEGIEFVERDKCLACTRCLNYCPTMAISRSKNDTKMQFRGPTKKVFQTINKENLLD